MGKKSSIYTRTGDKGTTSLVGGDRIKKGDLRIECYGEVDELNSWIGFTLSALQKDNFSGAIETLQFVQNQLFDLGSNLACEAGRRNQFKLPSIGSEVLSVLESQIDLMDNELPPLKNFILPGGVDSAARTHVCRSICRRVERKLIQFQDKYTDEAVAGAVPFLNRLSDYLFILGRYINLKENYPETTWTS